MTLELARALPFIAAALAQTLAAVVRRLSGNITSSHFSKLEASEIVVPFEEEVDPVDRPRRLARDVIPDGYKADAIATVNSKNAEGANALTGSIALMAAVLGSGLIVESIWYSIAVYFSVLLGLAFAVWLWVQDTEKYTDKRWLGISRSAVILAIVNLVLGSLALVAPPAVSGP